MVFFATRERYPARMSGDASIAAAAVLADDLRRRMYAFIRRADGPVTRDQAAAAVGISRKLAAFHLDKLAAAGLLRTSSARSAGLRRVGRAPKAYEPAGADVQVSIPPREHAMLAGILVDAVLATGDAGASQAALQVARERGRELGLAERATARPGRLGTERALTLASGFLERSGFEPVRAEPALMLLRNCPFHPLAAHAPKLVCSINQAFLAGFLEGLGTASAAAILRPRPGNCCVELRAASPVP
jgi:predicted ArsR family transcriptional regulator